MGLLPPSPSWGSSSSALHTRLDLSHPLVFGVSHCICSEPLDPIGIHLLCCTHCGERMASHDVVWDVFTTITIDVRFHVSQEQTHVLPPHALQFLCHWVDIVLLINGVHTLVDIVIVDPIQVDLVPQVIFSCGVLTIVVIQTKDGFYWD
jgi:hypothetical protein